MVSHPVHSDGIDAIRKPFNDIADFKIILAIAVRREPPGSDVVDPVAGNEWIVVGFGDLVTESGDVLESAAKDAGTDPAGIIHYVPLFQVAVGRVAEFIIIGMETDDAALAGIAVEIKECVG